MNDWAKIKEHYAQMDREILAEKKNEWAIDPYAWDTGMITMTPIERMLWADLRMHNAIFYPQYPIGGVFVDFANPVAKVAIECDGKQYHTDKAKDRERDGQLESRGWIVYRISGADCIKDFDEEEMRESPASVFVRNIVDTHGVKR